MIQKYIRKLTKTSKASYTLNVPKVLIDRFGWKEHQKLEISFDERSKTATFQVSDWKG